MMNALAITEAGMSNDVQRLEVISNNLANVSTLGFKKEIGVERPFQAYLADGMPVSMEPNGPTFSRATDFSDGTLKYTGNPLDLAIEGGGFLTVDTPQGEALTRQGGLQLDVSGRLVTSSGFPVLGTTGEIRLTSPTPRIDQNGVVWEGTNEVAQLRLVKVDTPQTLIKLGNGLYMPSDTTDMSSGDGLRLRQGYAETANVVTMNEMIKLIETVRHFETSQRLIHGYDDMLDRAINVAGEL